MPSEPRVVRGTVEFLWDDGSDLLLNMDPDDPGAPHTFEIAGELRDRVASAVSEGARVEVVFVPVEHEVVDPDTGPSETSRADVRDVRVLDG
jgi:hypothetical protein